MKMRLTMKSSLVLSIILSVIGVVSVFAIPAMTSKGTGCAVRTGPGAGDYAYQEACEYHQVVKLDDNGTVQMFMYQDHGQVPTEWRPDKAMRTEFDTCFNAAQYNNQLVCGRATEIVTPSGEYKSSFKAN